MFITLKVLKSSFFFNCGLLVGRLLKGLIKGITSIRMLISPWWDLRL